jgi:outer membrane autotransporter protein
LGWAHQFQDDHPAMTASWVGAPVSAGYRDFTVRGPQISRDSLVVGAGLTAEVGKDTRLFVSYDGVINNERTGHAFLAGVRVTW